MRKFGAILVVAVAGCAARPPQKPPATDVFGPQSQLLICPSKETLCGDNPVAKNHDGAVPPPAITYSMTVRYCDKPVVVWVIMKDGGKIARFDADDPITDEFRTVKEFTDWLAASPNETYDLPCVPIESTKPLEKPEPK